MGETTAAHLARLGLMADRPDKNPHTAAGNAAASFLGQQLDRKVME